MKLILMKKNFNSLINLKPPPPIFFKGLQKRNVSTCTESFSSLPNTTKDIKCNIPFGSVVKPES